MEKRVNAAKADIISGKIKVVDYRAAGSLPGNAHLPFPNTSSAPRRFSRRGALLNECFLYLLTTDRYAASRRISQHKQAFGAVQANADVSFSIAKGSIHGVIGENGAGKSTLMSILYGYYNADSGQVLIDGQARDIRTSHEAIALGIGMVHQHFMLVENMTVLDNVMLGNEGGFKLAPSAARSKRSCARSATATASTSIRSPPSTTCPWAPSSASRSSSRSTAAPTS
jgi:hypothetical protein